jgi:hypothetical protein
MVFATRRLRSRASVFWLQAPGKTPAPFAGFAQQNHVWHFCWLLVRVEERLKAATTSTRGCQRRRAARSEVHNLVNWEDFMLFTMQVITLLCLSSAFVYAENWSGTLVDSKCFAIEELNVNPTDTSTYVDHDQNQELRLCAPGAKTKSFEIVQHDGVSFKLDSAGNTKATEIVRNTAKKSRWAIVVTGEMTGNTIQVNSISLDR